MILITRPKEHALETQEKLSSMGFESKIYPLLEIVKLDSPDIIDHNYTSVIVTSQHAAAVAAQVNWLKEKPAYIVGSKSAKLLNGFDIKFVAKDSVELLKHLQKHLDIKAKILFICGDHIADNFDKKLVKSGYTITRSTVYKSSGITNFDETILNNITSILFYSPRTAAVFTNVCKADTSDISAICISQNTSNALLDKNFKDVKIAREPNEDSMLKLLL